MWELIVDEARRRFPGVDASEENGRFVLLLHPQLTVVFKKLSEDGFPSNYPTQAALSFSRQPELPLMGDFARVTVGYVLDRLGTNVASVSLTCFHGTAVLWSFELPQRRAQPVVVKLTPPRRAVAVVKPRPVKRVQRKPAADLLPARKAGRNENDT
jgi:hypothetical protein